MRALLAALMLCACTVAGHAESGIASVYGGADGYCNKPVAAGGVLDCRALTAAHKTLPFGTAVKVTIRDSGKSIVVKINDRGPFVRGRIIDLTPAAAAALGCRGLCAVTIEPFSGYVPKHGDLGFF
jgi:peptidoglycan lytic transglycosylase